MVHLRNQIRDAVVAALSGNTDAGTNVTPSRVYPFASLPGICVYTPIEESEPDTTTHLLREVDIVIEAYADTTLDDTIDDLAADIETAMSTDSTFGGLCLFSWLSGTETDLTNEAEKAKGVITLTFKAQYRTAI